MKGIITIEPFNDGEHKHGIKIAGEISQLSFVDKIAILDGIMRVFKVKSEEEILALVALRELLKSTAHVEQVEMMVPDTDEN